MLKAILFSTIYMDPNWNERGGGKIKRGADRHYELATLKQIYQTIRMCELFRPADNAHLYLWVTDNFLPSGIELMRLLEFRYIRTLPWFKSKDNVSDNDEVWIESEDELQMGIGQYFRGCTEILLFGVRGKGYAVCTNKKNIRNAIVGRRTNHSRKPESAYEKIEARSKGPYLEMYATRYRKGWTSWGDRLK